MADERRTGSRVDPGRLEQRVGDRARRPARAGVSSRPAPDALEQPADQREAVRVRAAGGEADDRVAGLTAGAADHLAALADRRRRTRPGRSRRLASCRGAPPSRRPAARSRPAGSHRRCPPPARRSAPGTTLPQVITSRKKAGRAPLVSTSLTHIATRSTPRPCSRPAALPSRILVPTPSQPAASSGSPRLGVNRPANPPTPPTHARGVRRGHRFLDPLDHLVRRLQADAGGGVGQRLVAHPAAARRRQRLEPELRQPHLVRDVRSGSRRSGRPGRSGRRSGRSPPAARPATGRRARSRPARRAPARRCGRRRSAGPGRPCRCRRSRAR